MSEPEARKGARLGVPLAAAGLVGAVWLSLQFAPEGEGVALGTVGGEVPLPEALPGFRADAWFLPDDGTLGFVEIPGGPFIMGSDPALDPLAFDLERWSAARPQGTVDVPTFLIGRFEVTVAQFAAFVRETGHRLAERAAVRAPPDHPVTLVSWADAVAYAGWLHDRLASSPETPPSIAARLAEGWEVGLPTEAQWEKAARGEDGRIFPWGDELSTDMVRYRARGAAPVGSHPCPDCAYGLADMAGNAWELTRSPYQPYPYDAADDDQDLEAEALFVMRGGGYADAERNVRAAIRGGIDPGARAPEIGFRVVIARF